MIPIILLHGMLGTPADWSGVCQAWQGEPQPTAVTLPVAADWSHGIYHLLANLPQQSVLVGYSLGARVALGCVLAAPQRFRGLCLISGSPGLESDADRALRQVQDEKWLDQILHQPLPDLLQAWYGQPVFASVDPATRQRWCADRQSLDRRFQAALLRCYSLSGQPNYWPILASHGVPYQLIVGGKDPKYLAVARRMAAVAPAERLDIVPDAGHAVHRERPEKVARLIAQFIAKIRVQGAST